MINRINPAFIAYNRISGMEKMPKDDMGSGLLQRSKSSRRMNMSNPVMRVNDYITKIQEMKEAINGRDES